MAYYESTFLIRPDLSAQDAEQVVEQFTALVKEKGGRLIKQEYWGLRPLAYLIHKAKKAHYIMLGIETPGDTIREIERQSGIHEDIMRNVTIKVDDISEEPSVMMQKQSDDKREEETNS